MKISTICILGGSGFVGRHLAAELGKRGYQCHIPTRRPHLHRHLQVIPGLQLLEMRDLSSASLQTAFTDCDAVINLIGILNESGSAKFDRLHTELVLDIVRAAQKVGVRRYLHMSALNANASSGSSHYLRSKGAGENHAHTHGKPSLAVTSFRPSVIFGADDSFINRFKQLMQIPGPLPLACADARFAPVYIGDVVAAFANALEDPKTFGQSYELCGPETYTLREIIAYIAHLQGRSKWVLPLGDRLSRWQARLLEFVPGKPFTRDNYLSLQTPSICKQNGLAALGIQATPMDAIVPDYIR
jgi:NADH dehydrogenase